VKCYNLLWFKERHRICLFLDGGLKEERQIAEAQKRKGPSSDPEGTMRSSRGNVGCRRL
jgi:hypothetical protein